MIALRLLPLFLCALAARVSAHPMDSRLATTGNVAWLPSAVPYSLHRRGDNINLNEKPNSYGESGHHGQGETSSLRNEHMTKRSDEVDTNLKLGPPGSSQEKKRKASSDHNAGDIEALKIAAEQERRKAFRNYIAPKATRPGTHPSHPR